MTDEQHIKPCPFCGEPPQITKHFKIDAWRLIHRCHVVGPISIEWRENQDVLIAAWNKRVLS